MRREIPSDMTLLEQSPPSIEHKTTDRTVENNELRHIIEAAVQQLPLEYRMVFALRELNDVSVAEAADLLHISEINVKVRLNRAKAMLRKEIEKMYSGEEIYEFHARHCDAMVHRVSQSIHALLARNDSR